MDTARRDNPVQIAAMVLIGAVSISPFLGLPVIVGAMVDGQVLSEAEAGYHTTAGMIGGILASIMRWDQLLQGQGYRAPFRYLTGSFLVGRFFGMFLPSTLGLDGYRAYDMARQCGDAVRSVAVIVVEKITGFFTLSLLVLVTLPAGLRFLPPQVLVVVFFIFCVPVIISFFLLLKPSAIEWALGGRPGR